LLASVLSPPPSPRWKLDLVTNTNRAVFYVSIPDAIGAAYAGIGLEVREGGGGHHFCTSRLLVICAISKVQGQGVNSSVAIPVSAEFPSGCKGAVHVYA